MAADELGRLLGGKGRVLLLRYQEGSASTTAREEGFLARLKAAWPGLELVSTDQYAGATVDTAKRASENLLNRYGRDVQGVFVVNETSTGGHAARPPGRGARRQGEVRRLRRHARPSSTRCARGSSHGFVLQNPFHMAELARGDDGRPPARASRCRSGSTPASSW